MKDSFNREIHALRISVTDRCNMRCRYCVSGDLLKLKPAESLLSIDEIESVIRASLTRGFDAFRFTGGEITGEFLMSTGWIEGAHHPACPIAKEIAALGPPWVTA